MAAVFRVDMEQQGYQSRSGRLSREAVTQYGIAIKALQPDKYISVLGYCNDVPSYLPNAVHIKAGTYEGYNSFFWNAQPCLFPENVFDVVIKKVKEKF